MISATERFDVVGARACCFARFARMAAFALLVVLAQVSGCSKPVAEEVFEPENWQGEIDTSLSKSDQDKQDAVIRLFTAIGQVGIEQYQLDCPDISFGESFEEFFGNAVSIHRWDWVSPPDGNKFSVRIYLEQDNPADPHIVEDRMFEITRSGNRFDIKRIETSPVASNATDGIP